MFVGHLSVGLIGKRLEPKISLGTWTLAVMLADLVFFPLSILRIESFHAAAGVTQNRFVGDVPFSHSLLMDAIWGGLFAGGYYVWRRNRRGAWLLFGAVLSHWLLDVISHRPDMPIVPGVNATLGLGLWNSIPATVVIEGGLWVVGIALYVRATRATGLTGIVAFWAGIAFLTLAWWGNVNRGMDPDPVRAGVGGLIFFSLVVAWAYWMNRLRPVATPARPAA